MSYNHILHVKKKPLLKLLLWLVTNLSLKLVLVTLFVIDTSISYTDEKTFFDEKYV